jgi:FMN phosphatase YigB (HAD superfamily)
MKLVYSFDVFDTLLTRNVYRPADLFLRIQGTLQRAVPGEFSNEVCRDYRNIRVAAESAARRQLAVREEVTLREILAVIARRFKLSDAAVAMLEELEIAEELASVVPIGSAVVMLRAARGRGRKINYVSDIYLPDAVIASMLSKVKLLEPGDGIFVSGGRGVKKSTGSLFRVVLDELGIRPNQMVHVGDYLWSDYLVPRFKCGIRSLVVRTARDNIYEKLWGDGCRCQFCSSIAGASRAARVAQINAGSVDKHSLYNIGCNVIGPIVAVFILWTLQQAKLSGVRRLYFLSRDGDIMLEAARHIAASSGYDIEQRYLQVSRTSVFPALAGLANVGPPHEWVMEDNIVLTLRILADRLKVDVSSLRDRLADAGWQTKEVDAPLAQDAVERVNQALKTDPALREMVRESGLEAHRALSGYLEQEGLFDGTPSALVDLGWHGTIQDVIHACYKDRLGSSGIPGYYFGVDRPGHDGCRKKGFFFEGTDAADKHRHLFRVLLEVMCSAPHGMVHHYTRGKDGVHEVVSLAPEHPENIERVQQIRRGVGVFLQSLHISSEPVADYTHLRSQILSVLLKLFLYPSLGEASALGDMRFSADLAGHGVNQFAPPFKAGTVLKYFGKRSYAGRSTLSSWFFASLARSPLWLRCLLYPLSALLRMIYSCPLTFRIAKLRVIDFINRIISIN